MSQATALRESAPASAPAPAAVIPPAAPAVARKKGGGRRFVLMVVVPALAVVGGLFWWVNGGRYVSTDNAYIGADKALITPYVTGPILTVHVIEGQHVKAGDPLFDLDPAPYRDCAGARERQAGGGQGRIRQPAPVLTPRTQINCKMNQESVRLKQADLDRKKSLVQSRSGTQADLDTSQASLLQNQEIAEFVRYMLDSAKVKLGGGPDNVPIEQYPDYMMAKAAVDDADPQPRVYACEGAHRRRRHAGRQYRIGPRRARRSGGLRRRRGQGALGRRQPQGIRPDLRQARASQRPSPIDTYPDRQWKGAVCSIAPGTGAQFAILPPQNASGNWVKVVQRVPLRFCFDADQDTAGLRAGMSSVVSVDTGRVRSFERAQGFSLVSWGRSWVEPAQGRHAQMSRGSHP